MYYKKDIEDNLSDIIKNIEIKPFQMIVQEYKKRSDENVQALMDLNDLENTLSYFKFDSLQKLLT